MKPLMHWCLLLLICTATTNTFGQTVIFSAERGFYDTPFQLTLTTSIAGGTIHYTTNGTAPTTSSGIIYAGSIPINTTSVIRALAYSGGTVSPVMTQTYLFINDVIHQPANVSGWPNNTYSLGSGTATAQHDYEMDPDVVNNPDYSGQFVAAMKAIPTMSIVMDKNDFWAAYDGEDIDKPTSVEIMYPATPERNEQFGCEIESHSHKRLKRSLKLKFPDPVTSKIFKYAPLNNQSAVETFFETAIVLRAGNNRAWSRNWNPDRTTFTRDQWYRDSQIAMSGEGSRGTFMHLYVNGIYWGLYNPIERPDEGFASAYFGGSIEDWMSRNHDGLRSGDDSRYNYIINTLVPKDMSVSANYQELKQYLDVEKFSEYLIVTWMTGMTDWPQNNYYALNRNNPPGLFRYLAWDSEWSWDVTNGSNEGAWVHPKFRTNSTGGSAISNIWHSARKSPEFMQLFADRVYEHCFNNGAMTDDNERERWMLLNNFISSAIIGESARWGDALNDGITRTKNTHWQPEVNRVDGLMNGNVSRFINALSAQGYYPSINPPIFNKETGVIAAGFNLSMSNPNGSGTIYYTIDGSDPKTSDGTVSGSASVYSSSIPIPGDMTVKARVKDGSIWSALHIGTYSLLNLKINEFLASNVNGIVDELGAHEDWIEIYNGGAVPVDIGGMYLTDNLNNRTLWQIPTTNPAQSTIPANGFLLLWADNEPAQGVRHLNLKLSKGGEQIGLAIIDGVSTVVLDSLTFGSQTDDVSTGRYLDGSVNIRTFTTPTPGQSNKLGFATGLYINEFLAGNVNGLVDEAGDHEDWIEIYNSNIMPVDIGGMYITDNLTNPLLFQIPTTNPAATTIPAHGFVILWADAELAEGPLHITPKLGKGGEQLGLTQVIGNDQQFLDSFTFGAQTDDISQGRYPDGNAFQRFFNAPTPGMPNLIPFISGLYINEFLAENTSSSGIVDEFGEANDWIEIYNSNTETVNLEGKYLTNNLGNPTLWQIPSGQPEVTSIPAKGFLKLWADNQTAQGPLHLGFQLSEINGEIGLVERIGTDVNFIDSTHYFNQVTNISLGRYPDGSENFVDFSAPSPGGPNTLPLIQNLFINEWVASNGTGGQIDEFGSYDDWFEIYNANTSAVDVGGLFITDNLANPTKWQIPTFNPTMTTIPAGGFIQLWADEQPFQGVRHVNIKLSAGGEQLGIIQVNNNNITYIDSLTFGSQVTNISQGRTPDGGATIISFNQPTPSASNSIIIVSGISLTPLNTSINLGNTVQITANVTPSNATNNSVIWSSSNPDVASVSQSGLVTGLTIGNVTITARTQDGDFTATTLITVRQSLPLLSIESFALINSGSDLDILTLTNGLQISQAQVQGISLNIRANAVPSVVGSVFLTLSGPVNASTTENVAPYALFGDTNGNYKGRTLPIGNYTMTATAYSGTNRGGIAGTTSSIQFSIVAAPVLVTGITTTPSTSSLLAGNTVQVVATVLPANASNKTVLWSTSDQTVATVNSNGLVTAESAGEATITATTQDGNFFATTLVTVTQNVPVIGIATTPATSSLTAGNTIQITETVLPSNATNKTVLWSTSNQGVATVSNSGLVMAVSPGGATIKATTQDGNFLATTVVTITQSVTGITTTPSTSSLIVGSTVQVVTTVLPANATNKNVVWSTSNQAVAMVNSNGLVMAVSPGGATITATAQDGNFFATTMVTVTQSLPSLTIESFTLINSTTDLDLFPITNGQQISQDLIQGLSLNIRANTFPLVVGSVFLTLSGPVNTTITENMAPYDLFGDTNGNYRGRTLPVSNYTLTARAYSGSNRGGTAGIVKTITFSITSAAFRIAENQTEKGGSSDSQENASMMEKDMTSGISASEEGKETMFGFKIYPNPVEDKLYIQMNSREDVRIDLAVYDMMGRLYITKEEITENGETQLDLTGIKMAPGTYLLVLDQGHGLIRKIKFIKKLK